jgi:quercetin dioxygenase-like cupin family protein
MAKARAVSRGENGTVRITEWQFTPGDETGHHRHEYDYVVVPLYDGTLRLDTAQGASTAELKKGIAYSRKAGVEHNVTNAGEQYLAFVDIELLEHPEVKPRTRTANVEQFEDVWSRAKTVTGFPVDEIRSVLQKSIRRGLLEEAMLAAYELYASGPETEELLWRRLEIIAVEDVGYGQIQAPFLIEALNAQRGRWPRNSERWMFSAHAVRLLATAKKDRTSMEIAGWAEEVTSRGERSVIVEDYHVDMHTARGVTMGRGREQWWAEGAVLLNQIDGLDCRWGDYLRRLYAGTSGSQAIK